MLHIFALLMMMSETDISREPLNFIVSECKRYIDDLFQESRLRPKDWEPDRERRPEGYFDGFAYWVMDAYKEEFNEVNLHLRLARKRALERELPSMASELLSELIPSSIEGDSFRGFPSGKKSESMRRTDTEVRHGQSGCVTGRF